MVGLAAVEHEGVAVADDRDRGVAVARHRRKQRILGRDDAARPDLLARRRLRQVPPQIAADRGREPGEPVRLRRRFFEHGQFTDRRPDDLRRRHAADARPVRVLPAVERSFVVETVAQERLGQIDDPDAARPQVPVDVLQRRVEPPHRDRHVERRREPVGIDDALRRHGGDDELDAVASETFRFRRDRGDGAGRAGRFRPQRGDFSGGEVPAVAAGDDRRAGFRRLGRQPRAGEPEPLDQFGLRRSAAGGGKESDDERPGDPRDDGSAATPRSPGDAGQDVGGYPARDDGSAATPQSLPAAVRGGERQVDRHDD